MPVAPVVDPKPTPAPAPKPTPAPARDLSIKTKLSGLVVTSDKLGAATDARVEIWFTDIHVSLSNVYFRV